MVFFNGAAVQGVPRRHQRQHRHQGLRCGPCLTAWSAAPCPSCPPKPPIRILFKFIVSLQVEPPSCCPASVAVPLYAQVHSFGKLGPWPASSPRFTSSVSRPDHRHHPRFSTSLNYSGMRHDPQHRLPPRLAACSRSSP